MAEERPTAKELRAMPEPDMRAQLEQLYREIWQARQKTAEGAQTQTHRVSAFRRQIARIHTVLNQRRRQADVKA